LHRSPIIGEANIARFDAGSQQLSGRDAPSFEIMDRAALHDGASLACGGV
jgi:hypothetical protein